jgi:hypothetical protein
MVQGQLRIKRRPHLKKTSQHGVMNLWSHYVGDIDRRIVAKM